MLDPEPLDQLKADLDEMQAAIARARARVEDMAARANDASNVVRDPFLAGLKADIAEGLAELRAGRGEPWPVVRAELEAYFATLPEFDDE